MTDAFVYALVIIAILGPLAGVALGVYLAHRSGASDGSSRERQLVRCPHGNEWYEPAHGITAIGCSLCVESGQAAATETS